MSDIKKLIEKIKRFRNEREWKQFHNPKDVALSLILEAAELLEHFQWKDEKEIREYIKTNKEDIGEELADVLYWVLLMSNDLEINISKTLIKKIRKNEKRYPIEKAKGKHTKYNKLEL